MCLYGFENTVGLGTYILPSRPKTTEKYLPSKPRHIYQVLKLQCYFYEFSSNFMTQSYFIFEYQDEM